MHPLGIIIIYYGTYSRGMGFKIWVVLEIESVPKLLHSHLPNQVIEPFRKDCTYPILSPQNPHSPHFTISNSSPKSNFKILFPLI